MEVLKKIIAILDILGQEESLGSNELAKRLSLPKTTVNRIMKELTYHGLLEQNIDTKRYRLGWKMVQLASECLQHEHIDYYVPLIGPYLHTLSEETGETVFLAVMKQNKVFCIYKVEGKRHLRYFTEVGRELPINCSAPAKVLLAYQPKSVRIDIIEKAEFIRYTPDSICNKDKLIEELNMTRLNGYGVCNNEVEIGGKAIAVPVLDKSGNILASIALIGPFERVASDFDKILSSMKHISNVITHQLNRS